MVPHIFPNIFSVLNSYEKSNRLNLNYNLFILGWACKLGLGLVVSAP